MGIRKVRVFFQRFLETVPRLLGAIEFIQGIAQIIVSLGMIRVTGNSKPVTALGINEQLLSVVDIPSLVSGLILLIINDLQPDNPEAPRCFWRMCL